MKINSNTVKKELLLGAIAAAGSLAMTYVLYRYVWNPNNDNKPTAKILTGSFGK